MTEKEKRELAEKVLKRNGYDDYEILRILDRIYKDKKPPVEADNAD